MKTASISFSRNWFPRAARRIASPENWSEPPHGSGTDSSTTATWSTRATAKKPAIPAARFLIAKGNAEISSLTVALWEIFSEDAYEKVLDTLEGAVADYIKRTPDLRSQPTKDMWDYRDMAEDWDDSCDEEEDYDDCEDDYDEEEDY